MPKTAKNKNELLSSLDQLVAAEPAETTTTTTEGGMEVEEEVKTDKDDDPDDEANVSALSALPEVEVYLHLLVVAATLLDDGDVDESFVVLIRINLTFDSCKRINLDATVTFLFFLLSLFVFFNGCFCIIFFLLFSTIFGLAKLPPNGGSICALIFSVSRFFKRFAFALNLANLSFCVANWFLLLLFLLLLLCALLLLLEDERATCA